MSAHQFKSITKSLRKLGITGPIIFTGSAVLKSLSLLDRDITDIDIIIYNDYNNKKIIYALAELFSLKSDNINHYDYPEVPVKLYYQDIHLDIFLKDPYNIKVEVLQVENEDFFISTPKHIVSKKLEYNREKDKEDVKEIFLNMLDLIKYKTKNDSTAANS